MACAMSRRGEMRDMDEERGLSKADEVKRQDRVGPWCTQWPKSCGQGWIEIDVKSGQALDLLAKPSWQTGISVDDLQLYRESSWFRCRVAVEVDHDEGEEKSLSKKVIVIELRGK